MPETKISPEESSTMKAAYVTEFCEEGTVPDSIVLGEIPALPPPIKRQVIVGVKATAINVDDIAGLQDTAMGGWCAHLPKPKKDKPLVGGCEYAGVVTAAGPDCTKLKVGDRVCGVQNLLNMQGTWAEQTVTEEDHTVPMPDDISFVEAAAVGMAAHVDADMVNLATNLEGGRCLVLGASGGLGTVMLQLLKERGVHVTAVCSGTNAEMVRRLGADEVVDYKVAPFGDQLAGGDKFDVVFDFLGGRETQRSAAPLLRRGGQFITAVGPWQGLGDRKLTCGEWTGWACGLAGRILGSLCLPCCRSYEYRMSMEWAPLKAEAFNAVAVEAGARGEVALEVPFEEEALRDALRRVATRRAGGKVIVNLVKTDA